LGSRLQCWEARRIIPLDLSAAKGCSRWRRRSGSPQTDKQYCVARRHFRAELLLHLHGSDYQGIEPNLRRAIAVARQQGAKGWELPAAANLARLWADRGRCSEARELLAPIYGGFTEGFDTCDLREAKALLDALS